MHPQVQMHVHLHELRVDHCHPRRDGRSGRGVPTMTLTEAPASAVMASRSREPRHHLIAAPGCVRGVVYEFLAGEWRGVVT